MRFRSLLLAACLALTAFAQEGPLPEYGDVSELSGKGKVYVTAELAESRKNILRELAKYKALEVVDSPDDAEFLLLFTSRTDAPVSKLSAVVIQPGGRRRVLWEEDEHQSAISKPNSVNLTRKFIKALKKVRGN